MEYKVTVQFNKELGTYVAEAETIGVTTTGDSAGEAVGRLEIKYIELVEKATMTRGAMPPREIWESEISKMEIALTEEKALVATKKFDEIQQAYVKQRELMVKIINANKTDKEKLELIEKLSKA